jgi:alpha-galactosidase
MEDPWVDAHLTKYVIDNLKENDFGYIKIDYNDTMGIGCDGPEGMGENLRNKVLATQKFFRKMKKEIPDLVIESCSSGGHRLEPSFMELASMASFSDAHECLSLPIIAANMHRVIKPSQSQIWAVMRKDDSDERIFYSICSTFLGRMGLSGDVYDLNDHQWELLDEGMAFYHKAADIIKNGKTTHLVADTESYNDPTGAQLVIREHEGKTLIVYHRFRDSKPLEEFAALHHIEVPQGEAIATYGRADKDFSACGIIK